jgi:PTS system mannose-specific IID component
VSATNPATSRAVSTLDLWAVFARGLLLQALWNPERMQGQGFAFALRPIARRLAGREGEAAWLSRHLGYFNTNPVLSGVALGAVASLEEARERAAVLGPEAAVAEPLPLEAALASVPAPAPAAPVPISVERAKAALGPALAAIGDGLVWSSLRPVAAAIGILWVLRGSALAPVVFLFLYNSFHFLLRARGVFAGYKAGVFALDAAARARFARLSRGLSIAGVLAASGVVDAAAARVFSSARSIEGIWAAAGLVVGLVWGGVRLFSATVLGFAVVALALAWATLTR